MSKCILLFILTFIFTESSMNKTLVINNESCTLKSNIIVNSSSNDNKIYVVQNSLLTLNRETERPTKVMVKHKIEVSEISEIAKVMFGESGTNYRDAWYVAQVIKNRYDKGNHKSYLSVIRQPHQFDGYRKIIKGEIKDTMESIITRVMNNDIPDSLRTEAIFFCNLKLVTNQRIKNWFNTRRLILISRFNKHTAHYYYI
jgi:hypothetical protein